MLNNTHTNSITYDIPYVEGDGVGPELLAYSIDIANTVMSKCYGNKRLINWHRLYCGEKAAERFHGDWFPEQTINVIEQKKCALIGPITAPIGYGFKSLNVALRHQLGLRHSYSRYQNNTGQNHYILRDNTEDLPIDLSWHSDSDDGQHLANFMSAELGVNKVDFENQNVMAVKYVSKTSIEKLTDAAIKFAQDRHINHIIFVHHTDILPTSEGSMVRWMVEHLRTRLQLESSIVPPILIEGIEIEVCSLMQFFATKHTIQSDTLFISGNYIASIMNEYFTAAFGVKNKVSQTNYGNEISIFEPKHGPLHSLVNTDQINPTALLNAVVSLFQYLKCDDAALYLMDVIHTTEQQIKNKTVSFNTYQIELNKQLGR